MYKMKQLLLNASDKRQYRNRTGHRKQKEHLFLILNKFEIFLFIFSLIAFF